MKYKLIFLSLLILCGCQSINVFNFEKSLKKTETFENVFYENFSAKGIVKFYAKNKKISSRFNFVKNGSQEKIDFLDVFNNIMVTFKVEEEKIVIVDGAKKLNSDSLEQIINRPFFKTVILNFSNILMGKVEPQEVIRKYDNGLYELIKNEKYSIYYKMYNKDFLPVNMKIDFLNIIFDLKILNWTIIEK